MTHFNEPPTTRLAISREGTHEHPTAIAIAHGRADGSVADERAFQFFTESFNAWWPPQYHIGRADLAEAVLEGRVGGRWYERGVDGTECDWGHVRVWEPPHRLVVTWQINGDWQYDPDPGHASEVEVRFTATGPNQTLVEVRHDQLERLVAGQQLRDGITGGGGWPSLLEAFASTATRESR